MVIKSLEIYNFRNHKETKINLLPEVNLITGDNGEGKTNILEAIFLFASGKSFRGQTDKEMIKFGMSESYIKLVFEDRFYTHTLEINLYKNRKRLLFKDGCEVKRLSEYLGLFRAVVFTPDHLKIVKSSPENRRKLCDIAICQAFPRFVASLSEYNHLLVQKNNLLKMGINNLSMPMLDIYNEKLAYLSGIITLNRYNYVKKLSEVASGYMSEMTGGKEELKLNYVTKSGNEFTKEALTDYCLKLFEKKKEIEIAKKMSLCGCHHDDFDILINGKDAKSFASQGQQRSAVLSLKLAEGFLAKQYTGEDSVYLFDDVLSELDDYRRSFVTNKLKDMQFIMTSCEKSDFSGVIKVKNGEIIE